MSDQSFFEDPSAIADMQSLNNLTPEIAVARVKENLEKLEKVTLDIAVTGETGAGKSTFVNAIRGVSNLDEEAAETGVTEKTTMPVKYPHPTMPNVNIWDLPGIGTPSFRADKYLKQVEFFKYDFFIIVATQRFRENDIRLAKGIKKNKKQFYFVRTKIDNDIRAEEKKPNFDKEKTLSIIRKDCEKNLQEVGNAKVFLISAFELEKYDFQRMVDTLQSEIPEHKAYALVLSLPVSSLETVERKKKMFKKGIWALAFTSAGIAVVPVPGLSVACDAAILVSFFIKCYVAFGLDKKSLQKLSARVNKPVEVLESVMTSPFVGGIDTKLITRLFASATIGAAMALEYLLSNIPIAGSFAAGGLSFATTFYLLNKGLDEMAKDARAVLEAAGIE